MQLQDLPADSFFDAPLEDRDYARRRAWIASLAEAHVPGASAPRVPYTDTEERTWRAVWRALLPALRERACAEVLAPLEAWAPWERGIPQLADLDSQGGPLEGTGFRFEPVPGLVPARRFLEALGAGTFLSTQFLRHPSRPLYTPEPDLVHELVGHAASFAVPEIATLSRALGRAARGASPERMEQLERLYWFTLEFGLVESPAGPRALGAGLLSSAGELRAFEDAELRPFDPAEVAAQPFRTDDMQPLYFVARSLGALAEWTLAFLGPSAT